MAKIAERFNENRKIDVAIVGAGQAGLVTLKNLREVGLNAFAFERRHAIGGTWTYAPENDITSAIPTTIANVSKQGFCYTDFPFPDDTPQHPTQADVERYLKAYATHFDLYPHIRLGVTVHKTYRNASDTKWVVEYDQEDENGKKTSTIVEVDKLVFAHGLLTQANMPELKGIEMFKGTVSHSQSFKTPEVFKGKRVLVIGVSNTAGDIATSLVGVASQVYFSHRRGARIVSRTFLGKPTDHALSRRKRLVFEMIDSLIPGSAETLLNVFGSIIERLTFKLDPKWGFANPPSLCQCLPLANDKLVPEFYKGTILPVPGVSHIVNGNEVELTDGTRIAVDSIICATGYLPNYAVTPFAKSQADLRLWQAIFPLTYSDSLAYIDMMAGAFPTPVQFDLASMYVAQVFGGLTKLPPMEIMETWADEHDKWTEDHLKQGSVAVGFFNIPPWLAYVSRVVGCGVEENLGYGSEGWKFWWKERKFCDLLMGGLDSPHVLRLFEGDGKRKPWAGAKEAIYKANGA